MPTSFLDLPRELRDVIYEHLLISPTGYVTPIVDKRARTLRFNLHTSTGRDQVTNIPSWGFPARDWKKLVLSNSDVLSLSLLRTCQQIWQETRGIFWSNNTFLFQHPKSMQRTLKLMGQVPSRRIESISCSLETVFWKSLPKCLALLNSRTRHGSFQKLHLDVALDDLDVYIRWRSSSDATMAERYDELLGVLREWLDCSFQRTIRVHSGDYTKTGVETVRDLHLAFGSRIICDEALEWDEETS